jgi:hypothetical protein
MKVRFVDAEGTEYALANLSGAPQHGDAVVVAGPDDTNAEGTVVSVKWIVPSAGCPPKSALAWDLEVLVEF